MSIAICTPQDIYTDIGMRYHNKKVDIYEKLDLQCKKELEKTPQDKQIEIAMRYHNKKTEVANLLDPQCKKELDNAQSFYMSMVSVYRAAKLKNKSECIIKLCVLENLDKVPDELIWEDNINETNKKLIACFIDRLSKTDKHFTLEFNIDTDLGHKPIYSCYKKLCIQMKSSETF